MVCSFFVEVLEEKKPKLGKNSVFEVSIIFNVRREMLLPAGTKVGVAKTGSLAMLTHVPKKNKSMIPSMSITTPEFSTVPIDFEVHGEGDADSDSEIRDQFLENKQTSQLSSPRAEQDLSVDLDKAMDDMGHVEKQCLGEPNKIPNRQANVAEPLSKNEHTSEPELAQKSDAEFCDSSTTNQNQEQPKQTGGNLKFSFSAEKFHTPPTGKPSDPPPMSKYLCQEYHRPEGGYLHNKIMDLFQNSNFIDQFTEFMQNKNRPTQNTIFQEKKSREPENFDPTPTKVSKKPKSKKKKKKKKKTKSEATNLDTSQTQVDNQKAPKKSKKKKKKKKKKYRWQ